MNAYTYEPYKPKNIFEIEHFYSLFEKEFQKDYVFRGEAHDFWEIVCVREGNLCVCADERIFHLKKGDVVFHKPMEFHKFHIEGTEKTTLFIISFVAMGSILSEFEERVLHLSQEQNLTLSNMIMYLRNECSLGKKGYFECLNALHNEPIKFQTFICMLQLWLLSLLKSNTMIPSVEDTVDTRVFQNVVQTMEKKISEWVTVPDIAGECNVSVSYLKKIFAKYTGIGIHQYFLKMKITKATQMLKEGYSVAEVSDALSFCNANYFSNVFRRETGYAPSVYKKCLDRLI